MTPVPVAIEKENVANLRFPDKEVLKSREEIAERQRQINNALSLGNLEKGKIRIIFEDSDGLKKVETTIWGVTDKQIILKKGVIIPIYRIREVVT